MKTIVRFLAQLALLISFVVSSWAQTGSNYITKILSPTISDATPECTYSAGHSCWIQLTTTPSITQISAGYDGTVYGLDASGNLWTLPLHTRTWQASALSPMNQISVVSATNVWGLKDDGACASPNRTIYHYTGGTDFIKSGYCATNISAAPDGTVYRVRGTGGAVEIRTSTGGWAATTGAGGNGTPIKVAVGSASNVWVLTATHVIKVLNVSTNAFVVAPGWATDIAASSSDVAWALGGSNNGNNVYKWGADAANWTSMIGTLSTISDGGYLYTMGLNGNTAYHFNPIAITQGVNTSGSYTCPPGGCPTGSYHTAKATGVWGAGGYTQGTATSSGIPSALLSATMSATTFDCELFWDWQGDPHCTLTPSGAVDCSVMGRLYSNFMSGVTFIGRNIEPAFTNVYWNGPAPSCTTLPVTKITLCDYLVHNNCTAATTPPDNNLENKLLNDPYRPATYLDWTVLAACFRFLPGTPWSCTKGAAFLTGLNTPVPPYPCTHNP